MAKTFDAFGVEAVEEEPHYHKHIRNIAINLACQAHLPSCITSASAKFTEFMEGTRNGFSNDLETSIFCNGILNATKKEFDFMWKLYTNSDVSSRRSFYLRSIGCIEDEEILTKLIMNTIESDDIDNTNDEWLTIVQSVYSNGPVGLQVALKFLRENYNAFIGL